MSPTNHEVTAGLRQAESLLQRTRDLVARYKSGKPQRDATLEDFKELLPQILAISDWLASAKTEEYLRLQAAIPTAGAVLLHALLPPPDHILLLERALRAANTLQDERRARILHTNVGVALRRIGRLDEAARHFNESLEHARRSKDRRSIAVSLGNLANLEVNRQHPSAAIESFREAAAIFRELDEKREETLAMSNLGVALLDAEYFDESEDALRTALELSRELEDLGRESIILTNLGNLHARRGDDKTAIELYMSSLELDRKLDNTRDAATNLFNLSDKYLKMGQLERAEDCARSALRMRTEVGDARVEKVDRKLAEIRAAARERDRGSSQE